MPPADRPSLAFDLFTRIHEGDSVAILRAMVEEEPRAVENEWTEFKAYPWGDFKDPTNGCEPKNLKPDTKDFIKETWSQSLSGFANAGGGVLIWGIHAAKRNGVDEAQSLQLVPNPKALASRLTSLQRDSINPPLRGVRVQPYADPKETGKGFVVCYIPQGDLVPYRAEHCGQQYYIRDGDATRVPIPVVLRRLFFPQFQPFLRVEVALSYSLEPADVASEYQLQPTDELFNKLVKCGCCTMRYEARLSNDGTATAKDLYVVLQTDDQLSFNHTIDWITVPNPQGIMAFRAHRPLHPGEVSILLDARFVTNTPLWPLSHSEAESQTLVPSFNRSSLQLLMYTENSQRQTASVEFTPEDFRGGRFSVAKKGEVID